MLPLWNYVHTVLTKVGGKFKTENFKKYILKYTRGLKTQK